MSITLQFLITMFTLFSMGVVIGINIVLVSQFRTLSSELVNQKNQFKLSFDEFIDKIDKTISDRLDEYKVETPVVTHQPQSYDLANKLIHQGASTQEIIERCQISRNEIEMLEALQV